MIGEVLSAMAGACAAAALTVGLNQHAPVGVMLGAIVLGSLLGRIAGKP